jgi:hypothetical protein
VDIEVSISTSEETHEMALLGENVNTAGAETKDEVSNLDDAQAEFGPECRNWKQWPSG